MDQPRSFCDELSLSSCLVVDRHNLLVSRSLEVFQALINSSNAKVVDNDWDGLLHTLFRIPRPYYTNIIDFISLIPNVEEILCAQNKHGETPLHLACSDLKLVKLLLNQGNTMNLLNIRDCNGRTVLHYACGNFEEEVVKMILEQNSCKEFVDAKDGTGTTALHVAINHNHKCANLLLEAKCTPNIKDSRGNIPLHHAWKLCVDNVKLLPIIKQDVVTLGCHLFTWLLST